MSTSGGGFRSQGDTVLHAAHACKCTLACAQVFTIINHQVTDACGFRSALSAGWQGTRPCACDASKQVLNCELRQSAHEQL